MTRSHHPRVIVSVVLSVISVVFLAAPNPAAAQDRRKLDRALQSRASRAAASSTSRVIIRLRGGVTDASGVVKRVAARAGARLDSVNAQVADVADSALDALSADPAVSSVHLDRPLVSLQDAALTAATGRGLQGRASTAWDGSGVGVAIIDSGVMPHADLRRRGANGSRQRLAASVDFVSGRRGAYDGFGHGTL